MSSSHLPHMRRQLPYDHTTNPLLHISSPQLKLFGLSAVNSRGLQNRDGAFEGLQLLLKLAPQLPLGAFYILMHKPGEGDEQDDE